MTRLIDPPLKNLSSVMAEMGDLAIQSVELAIESYLYDRDNSNRVYEISSEITKRYFQVTDLTFDKIGRAHV